MEQNRDIFRGRVLHGLLNENQQHEYQVHFLNYKPAPECREGRQPTSHKEHGKPFGRNRECHGGQQGTRAAMSHHEFQQFTTMLTPSQCSGTCPRPKPKQQVDVLAVNENLIPPAPQLPPNTLLPSDLLTVLCSRLAPARLHPLVTRAFYVPDGALSPGMDLRLGGQISILLSQHVSNLDH